MSSSSDVVNTARRTRADAARNRSALIEAASAAFSASDGGATLEQIARAAGVGIGTLYRHFPTREDLVAAVYQAELDEVVAAATTLRQTMPPQAAFRAWVDRYASFVATKRGMAESLRAGEFAAAAAAAQTRSRVTSAIDGFLQQGAAAGEFRVDVTAEDVTTALVGIFLATRDTADSAQVRRLTDLVLSGLRP